MRRSIIMCSILLAGAVYSGAAAISTQIRYCVEWYGTPAAGREELILGDYAPVVRKVMAQVREEEGILLVTDMDPSPLPYALFPRRFWQMQTDTEAIAVYMELPPSPYPVRPPGSFPVSWRLDLMKENAMFGGKLTRLTPAGGRR